MLTDPMSKPGMINAIREFLAERPEYIPDFKTQMINGREEVLMSTNGTIAFAEWSISKGYGDVERSKRLVAWFRTQRQQTGDANAD